jgi:polyisoprenoid-binding protein YceI
MNHSFALLAAPALLMLCAPAAMAAPYAVDYKASSIGFSGTHAGNAFSGSFGKWTAAIDFDAAQPEASHAEVSIDTASAKTGNAMFDGTLPTPDWFNVKAFPKARFVSSAFHKNADDSYTAEGELTIRDKTQHVSFPFTLTPDAANPVVATTFTLTLDRLAFGLGADSDPKSEWVGRDITVSVKLSAARQ